MDTKKIKEAAEHFGWSDAYVRYLNREIREAGGNLIGGHDGMYVSDSLADRHHQAQKLIKQAERMINTADLMVKGEHLPLSEDAEMLFAWYPRGRRFEYETPELKQYDFIEVRDVL